MQQRHYRRSAVTAGVAAALVLTACSSPSSGSSKTIPPSQVPDKPKKAVTLNILDIAGNLRLTQA